VRGGTSSQGLRGTGGDDRQAFGGLHHSREASISHRELLRLSWIWCAMSTLSGPQHDDFGKSMPAPAILPTCRPFAVCGSPPYAW